MEMERFKLFQRNGWFYIEDNQTGKQQSLRTRDKENALELLRARNESASNPERAKRLARAYLAEADPDYAGRDLASVYEYIIAGKSGDDARRWRTAKKDQHIQHLIKKKLIDLTGEDILSTVRAGTVSTNIYLRRAHNFALDMGWIQARILPLRLWPKVRHRPKRAITEDEHRRITAREPNAERRQYYEVLWWTGASQSDAANLTANQIDWGAVTISFCRQKLEGQEHLKPVILRIGPSLAAVLEQLPSEGKLFPYLSSVRANDRATEFRDRCKTLGITGISLHSYRYAFAERCARSGMPETIAMTALGHNSKAIFRAYSKNASPEVPALEDLETKIIPIKKVG
ncbi:MAG: tyrosine-type recombinase/integrase [Verrucomicrobiota bacterium]